VTVTIGLAFIAGLASFFTPCVISLMPAYIGYLGGRAASNSTDEVLANRWMIISHGLFFILGFSLVFIGLGLAASAIGVLLFGIRIWLARIGGILVILFGLHLIGVLHIQWLDYDLRPTTKIEKNQGLFSSFLMGVFFSAGWSPCVGPILGGILTLAANETSISTGFWLLTAYSLGFAIPFLLMAIGINWIKNYWKFPNRIAHSIEIMMGIVLVVLGILLLTGLYEQLAILGSGINLGI